MFGAFRRNRLQEALQSSMKVTVTGLPSPKTNNLIYYRHKRTQRLAKSPLNCLPTSILLIDVSLLFISFLLIICTKVASFHPKEQTSERLEWWMPAAQLPVLLFEIKTILITLGCIPSAFRWKFSSVDVCFTHTLEGVGAWKDGSRAGQRSSSRWLEFFV